MRIKTKKIEFDSTTKSTIGIVNSYSSPTDIPVAQSLFIENDFHPQLFNQVNDLKILVEEYVNEGFEILSRTEKYVKLQRKVYYSSQQPAKDNQE